MKSLHVSIKSLLATFTIATFLSLACSAMSFAATEDEEYEDPGSSISAPGYIRVDKLRTDAFREVPQKRAVSTEEQIEKIGADLEGGKDERTAEGVKPHLKRKSAKEGAPAKQKISTGQKILIDGQEIIYNPDVNRNGKVDINDLDILAFAWEHWDTDRLGMGPAESPNADINRDGYISLADINLLTRYWGVTVSYVEPTGEETLTQGVTTVDTKGRDYAQRLGEGAVTPDTSGRGYKRRQATGNLTGVVTGLLANKDDLLDKGTGELDTARLEKVVEQSFLSLPAGEISPYEMQTAEALAGIIANPTEMQEGMLVAIEALLNETETLRAEDKELAASVDDFTEIATTILLAQAIPGLLGETDISSIRGIFERLDTEKGAILREYNKSVGLYYNSVVKQLAGNMEELKLRGILKKNATEDKLAELSQSEIDDIVARVHKIKGRTAAEEGILKEETIAKRKYLIPAKALLEENMKILLGTFSEQLFGVLDKAMGVRAEAKKE